MLSTVLKQKDIFNFFSRSALNKAGAYHAQGRVSVLGISDDRKHIRARVADSARIPYTVDIAMEFERDQLVDIDGDCTCPVGFNCKHVAATLLEALHYKGTTIDAALPSGQRMLPGGAPPQAVPVLPPELNDWLEKIGRAIRGNDHPADVGQRLLYRVEPYARDGRMPHLGVSLLSVRLRKDGEFSGQVSRPNSSSFDPDRAPAYYRDVDLDIVAGLSREYRTCGQQNLHLVRSVGLLHQIVNTGRAYWLDHKRSPLQWGEMREGRIEWRQASKAGTASHLIVAGATALDSEPPVYVEEASGMVGPVETGLPARLAHRILSAPIIPSAQVAEVARRLGQKLPPVHHNLLPGPPAAAMAIDANPTPVLRVMLGRPQAHAYYYGAPDRMPVAHLSFRYGPVEIELSEKSAQLEVFHGGQVYAVSRKRAGERDALTRLTDLISSGRYRFIPISTLAIARI